MKTLGLLLVSLLLVACSPTEQATPQVEQVAATAGPTPFKPTGDVLHIMQWVLDPAADGVWGSAGSIITAAGTKDLAPTTDEGWLAVQHNAAVIAETGNLLLLPGRAKDNEAWQSISLGLVNAGVLAQAAAAAHDADALFDAGGQIYQICKSCHALYIQDE